MSWIYPSVLSSVAKDLLRKLAKQEGKLQDWIGRYWEEWGHKRHQELLSASCQFHHYFIPLIS